MLKAIEEKPMAFELRMVDTDYIAKENHDVRVDDTYAMKTDLNKPCVLAEVKDGHYLLLDGNHRLRKAIKEKLSCVMCYCLKESQHQRYIEHYRRSMSILCRLMNKDKNYEYSFSGRAC